MENNWLNPLSPDVSNLISLSTSTVAPSEVVKDLPRALEVGEEAYQTFEGTGLDDDPPSVKFHDKIAKQRLKTFSTISTKTSRMKGPTIHLVTGIRYIFRCISYIWWTSSLDSHRDLKKYFNGIRPYHKISNDAPNTEKKVRRCSKDGYINLSGRRFRWHEKDGDSVEKTESWQVNSLVLIIFTCFSHTSWKATKYSSGARCRPGV